MDIDAGHQKDPSRTRIAPTHEHDRDDRGGLQQGQPAVDVLNHAPTWWNHHKESVLRKWLWIALRDDSPGQLEAALRTYSWGAATASRANSGREGWELDKLLVRLRLSLWTKSKGKGPNGKRRGLLYTAACNIAGVPQSGAVRCIAKLLELSPPGQDDLWQLRIAVQNAGSMGRDAVVAQLRPHLDRLEAEIEKPVM
jgi:hypothetical protein